MWFDIESDKELNTYTLYIAEVEGKVRFGFELSKIEMEFLYALLKDELKRC